jgi:hypothetical protein
METQKYAHSDQVDSVPDGYSRYFQQVKVPVKNDVS